MTGLGHLVVTADRVSDVDGAAAPGPSLGRGRPVREGLRRELPGTTGKGVPADQDGDLRACCRYSAWVKIRAQR
jgi:hypothetical protein